MKTIRLSVDASMLMAILFWWCLAVVAMLLLLGEPAYAQQACKGPADLCAQVADLQHQLAATHHTTFMTPERAARLTASAGFLAVGFKMVISLIKTWSPYLRSDRANGVLHAIALTLGLGAGALANIALGLPWWQAMFIMGAGPLSVYVHEVTKLVPALQGKGPVPVQDVECVEHASD